MGAACIFCSNDDRVFENELAYAVYDKYPVNEGHMLVIPKRHMESFFEATVEEKRAITELLGVCREHVRERYQPDGFNIGINEGEAAGQTIMHLHVHLIPRYKGDVARPRGGVRGVDLFAGCGGISLGFRYSGFEIVGAVEENAAVAMTHTQNFFGSLPEDERVAHSLPRDITTTSPSQLVSALGLGRIERAVDIVVGGPPCQAYARIGRAKLREVSRM